MPRPDHRTKHLTPGVLMRCAAYYQGGATLKSLAANLKVSEPTLRRRLREAGYTIKPWGGARPRTGPKKKDPSPSQPPQLRKPKNRHVDTSPFETEATRRYNK